MGHVTGPIGRELDLGAVSERLPANDWYREKRRQDLGRVRLEYDAGRSRLAREGVDLRGVDLAPPGPSRPRDEDGHASRAERGDVHRDRVSARWERGDEGRAPSNPGLA